MAKRFFLICVMSMLLTACTCDGDIGDIYGQWAMDGMSVDGVSAPESVFKDFFWHFQGHVIEIRQLRENHNYYPWNGEFKQEGSKLVIDFHEWTDHNHVQIEQIGIDQGISVMDILSITSARMTLTYHDTEGVDYVYLLRKVR